MIPLIPSLVLAFLSFLSSAFVILRIVIPILPPHPLSRRVSPAEFGLPNFRSLSPAFKSHIWLHVLDLASVCIFVWQVISESFGGPAGYGSATDPLSSIRFWLAVTLRPTCLLVITLITLLHVRMARSVSFGTKHWMIWAPVSLLAITSTIMAAIMAGVGVPSLFVGLVAYSSGVAAVTCIGMICLVATLINIKRNLAALNDDQEPWPPADAISEKPRPSFATEEVDVLRDGASWITSSAGSRRTSAGAWSFSTHHTAATGRAPHSSVPVKSAYWFSDGNQGSTPPPVPPLPAPYGPLSPSAADLRDADPFRREGLNGDDEMEDVELHHNHQQKPRFGSQTSWLTSTNGAHTEVSAWSYPTTHPNASSPNVHAELLASTAVSRPSTPALAKAQVLGGYGYAPSGKEAEQGLAALAAPSGSSLHISLYHGLGWLFTILSPLALAYPFFTAGIQNTPASMPACILFVLAITLPSPIFALGLFLNLPVPIPSGLFDVRSNLPDNMSRPSTALGSVPPNKWSHEYKRSTSASVTVVEGRRSGDVWITNGDAKDGKSKMSRAFSMMAPKPKLSVLPPEDSDHELTPPLPIQDGDSSLPVSIHNTPRSETSAQFGRLRKESKASSYYTGADESMAYHTQIMVAQKHYSTLAQTMKVSTSPEKTGGAGDNFMSNQATASGRSRPTSGHLRSRSVSSVVGPAVEFDRSNQATPPPNFPLPPTPPNVRAARLAKHKKSYSSGFSFGPVDDMNEIDALTAGVLPLLVPGLRVGEGMKIKDGDWTPPGTFSKSKDRKLSKMLEEFGGDFSSPENHSTPAETARPRVPRGRKSAAQNKHHWSLPSLSLGKDGIHSLNTWTAEVKGALDTKVSQYLVTPSSVDIRRNTVFGGEPSGSQLQALVEEGEDVGVGSLGRAMSRRTLGLRADVPHSVAPSPARGGVARSSIASVNMIPASAASTATLFEELDDFSGPLAESTPHHNGRKRISDQNVPPVPNHRRSSIVYINSTEREPQATSPVTSPISPIASLANWSSRAVRPLLTRTKSKKQATPGKGLRPLSLLQDRNSNTDGRSSPVEATRPLQVNKNSRSPLRSMSSENGNVEATRTKNRNPKSLRLARTETSKMRGLLRAQEELPSVVVRPPSNTEHMAFSYNFQD